MTFRISAVCSMATRSLVTDLAEAHGRRAGGRVEVVAIGGVDAARRIRAGEVFDVVVLAAKVMADLARDGLVSADSLADVVRSGVAVAVPAGRPHPALASEEDVKTALRAASALAYSTGPSGDHLLRIIERLGLGPDLAGRLVQAPPGVPVAAILAEGRADLGVQQASELIGEPGIEVVGPLPPGLQLTTMFTTGICRATAAPDAARAFIAALVSPEAEATKRRYGLAPA